MINKEHIIIEKNDTVEMIFEKIKEKTTPAEWKQTILDLWEKKEPVLINILKNSNNTESIAAVLFDSVFGEIINTVLNLSSGSEHIYDNQIKTFLQESIMLRLLYVDEFNILSAKGGSQEENLRTIRNLQENTLKKIRTEIHNLAQTLELFLTKKDEIH